MVVDESNFTDCDQKVERIDYDFFQEDQDEKVKEILDKASSAERKAILKM